MSGYVVGSLIGGGFVLAGVLVTAIRDDRARKSERQAERTAKLENAMREYLAALDAIALEGMDTPPAPAPSRTDKALDWLAKQTSLDTVAHILVRVLRRAAYGRRRDDLVDRMTLAATQLRLIAPGSVLAIMREIDEATKDGDPSDAEWYGRWKEMRGPVRDRFREELAAVTAPSTFSRLCS